MTGSNNNLIPKENYKKVEEIREINNEVPSFEEFMKTYESDGNLNYDDLSYSDISDKGKGYGPCPDGCYQRERDGKVEYVSYQIAKTTSNGRSNHGKCCTCSTSSRFCLKVQCYNWLGDGGSFYACTTENALDCARALEGDYWYQAKVISDEVLLKCATLVREAVRRHDRGCRVKGYVRVQGRFWTGYESSYSY